MIQTKPRIMKPNITGLNQAAFGWSSVLAVTGLGALGFFSDMPNSLTK
jgi:hypothetical protein